MFRRYGDINIDRFADGNVHDLSNILTLSANAHIDFNYLRIWLEQTSTPHTYNVGSRSRAFAANYPATVIFTTAVPGLPLPDPSLLALHAACARVSMMSGAVEYFNLILRDMETTQVLASDGKSADLLYTALMRKT